MSTEAKWRYYEKALLPNIAPHLDVDITDIQSGAIWKSHEGRRALLVRWTSEFDSVNQTEWWYCIKDTPFDINLLKSKRRYEINKGKRNFHVKIIDPVAYIDEIVQIQQNAWEEYPKYYRPIFNEAETRQSIRKWDDSIVFGAFFLIKYYHICV